MNIDYITAHDPRDIKTWSGLNYFIMKALEAQGANINIITELRAKPNFGLKWRWHFYRLLKKNYQYEKTSCYTKQFGKQVNAQLRPDADLIFSTVTSALAFIKTNKPVFLYTDATFDNLAEFYNHFSKLPKASKRIGDKIEKLSLENCSALLFASNWAAQSAINYYKIKQEKVFVVPFGANLINPPNFETISSNIHAKSFDEIIFLFVAVEFERKGGPLAVEIVKLLNEKGINSRLIIAGMSNLNSHKFPEFVELQNYFDKVDENDHKRLESLYSRAHFFLMPTQKECYGIVYVEANAFGLPCIATNIAGIPSIITNGLNGYMFELNDPAEKYVAQISEILKAKEKYKALAFGARNEFEERLNWAIVGEKIFQIIESVRRN